MQSFDGINHYLASSGKQLKMLCANPIKIVAMLALLLACCGLLAEAGGKNKKGGGEDIIMYNGNIVVRGDKKGGSIIMANNQHAHTEEVEFAPSFFGGYGHHGMGGYGH